jgi:hypothetical protein
VALPSERLKGDLTFSRLGETFERMEPDQVT